MIDIKQQILEQDQYGWFQEWYDEDWDLDENVFNEKIDYLYKLQEKLELNA